jgi:hypothetical protein
MGLDFDHPSFRLGGCNILLDTERFRLKSELLSEKPG